MREKNANQFTEMYSELGIAIDKLGCIMVDLESFVPEEFPEPDQLYYTPHPDRFWINGFVADHTPHVTLLYGLLKSGNSDYRPYVDKVLRGVDISTVTIDHVGYFDSPYPDEPYYCLVAHVRLTDNLMAAHSSLSLLPHIDTFPTYKPHTTIAYIKKDEGVRNRILSYYNSKISGKEVSVKRLNYGK
jgi:2'-5' RNA ligase